MSTLPSKIEERVARVVRGKPEAVRLAVQCLFAEGHLLIEDVPGVGKTTLALSLARSLGLSLQRIQFTSDLLPSDILGVSVFNAGSGAFEFKSGPIFNPIILADEINRSAPKTQSALLEAMAERQVSLDGVTRPLPRPFFVIATQNPHEQHGTYPLPESQKDRFLMRISMGYPDRGAEREILRDGIDVGSAEALEPAASPEEVLEGIQAAKAVRVEESLDEYILELVEETRRSPFLDWGVSPRGALALRRAAQSGAYCDGRDFVAPDDIKAAALPVLGHRVVLKSLDGVPENEAAAKVVREILGRVAVPV
jgi:MoxR-like ATPase